MERSATKPLPLSPEAQALAADPKHISLARRIARVTSQDRPYFLDQAESAAMLGLCHAARSFDPALGLKFSTHAVPRIKGAILDDMRSWHHRVKDGPVFMPITGPIFSDEESPWDAVDSHDAFEALARRVRGQQRQALRLIFLDASAGSVAGAARVMGVDDSHVCRLKGKAIRELGELLRGREAK